MRFIQLVNILPLLCILCLADLYGQTKTVKGRILSEHLEPIPGAFIRTIDSVYTTTADDNGYFEIVIPENTKKLTAWFVGIEPETSLVQGLCSINFILLDDIIAEFETEKEHNKSYKLRKKELPKLFEKAIKQGLIETNKPCS